MRAIPDFFDYTIVGFSSQDFSYPVANLKVYDSTIEGFRTTAITEQTFTLDFGAPIQDPRVLIYGTNAQSIRYLGNNTNTWGSPAYDSTVLTIEEHPEEMIYKHGIQLTGFNNQFFKRGDTRADTG